jgi:predicted metalloendopeptidase
MRNQLLSALCAIWTLFVPAAQVLAQQPPSNHGIATQDMDMTIQPGYDFYRFANGGWLDRTTIPPDQSRLNALQGLTDKTTAQLLDLLASKPNANSSLAGSDAWKVVQLFEQGTDTASRESNGLTPVSPVLSEIDAIRDQAGLHSFLQHAWEYRVPGLLPLSVMEDLSNSQVYAMYLDGPSLGLPNRDYYTASDDATKLVQQAYTSANERMLQMIGVSQDDAMSRASAVYEFERRLATSTLTREQAQDFSLQYNPTLLADLAKQYPALDWQAYIGSFGIQAPEHVIVADTGYLAALPGVLADTPIETVKDYLRLRALWGWSDVLSSDLEQTATTFAMILSGEEEMRPLNERVLKTVNGAMPDAVGKMYVERYFPPEAKAKITSLAFDIIAAFRARLARNTWMAPETREKAYAKLDKVTVHVGYPDKWRSYDPVEIGPTYADSALSAYVAEKRRLAAQAGQPVNRDEWELPAQKVGAQYNPVRNEILIPAAILQAPYFDWGAEDAANYGGIGWVIGHEITHGFDVTGSQFDANGNLSNWWTPDDAIKFKALNDRLAAQYGAIEVLPGVFVNGQITVGENAADLGGIQVAFDAFTARQAETAATATSNDSQQIDATAAQFTPEQRFFIAASQIWHEAIRDEALNTLVKTDPHSPGEVRGIQPLRNFDVFYEVFGIVPGDPIFLPPDERVQIW